ncbi:TPA: TraI domain-containing protein [Proteus mirabilis]|nr:TraI domain-containing protein [Proteus mirabilis]
MLPWFRKSLSRKAEEKTLRVSPGNTQEKVLFIRDSDGFYLPQSADILLATPPRQNWLQQISRVVALPDNQYRALCLSPLQTLAERLQCVPASKNGKYASEGGFLDLTLNTTAWCMRMSQKEMLPRGLPSEEQSRQFSAWNVCVFYTGLFYWLPLTAQFEGQLNSLSPWQPGISPPSAPYRFRFHEPVPDIAHFRRTTGAMMAFRLLPEKVIHWLSGTPKVLQALSDVVTGQVNDDNDLQRVLNEVLAAFPDGTLPAFSSVVSVSAPDASSSVPSVQPESSIVSLAPAELAPKPQPETPPVTSVLPPEFVGAEKTENETHRDIPLMADAEGVVVSETPDSADEKTVSDMSLPSSDDVMYALELSGLLSQETETAQFSVAVMPDKSAHHNAKELLTGHSGGVSSEELKEVFIDWLKQGIADKSIPVNIAGGPVHVIADYLFLRSPQIFTLFLSKSHYQFERHIPVQRAFESLRLHRSDKKNSGGLIQCRIFNDRSDNSKPVYQQASGYLVKTRKLLPFDLPDASTFIQFVQE